MYIILFLVVSLVCLICFLLYRLYYAIFEIDSLKYKLKISEEQQDLYLRNIDKEKEQNKLLSLENVRLQSANQVIEKQNNNLIQFTDNIALKTKEHFFTMGKELTSQLIDLQKKESIAQRKESGDVVDKSIKHIVDKFDSVNQYVVSLQKQLKSSQDDFNKITDNILNPIKIQNLTEITLENILNSSGIRKGIDFFIQPSIIDNRTLLRPDVVVKLPGGKLLLIDAKSSSFKHDEIAKSMNYHIKQLSEKNYLTAALKYYNLQHAKSHMTAMFVSSDTILDQVMKQDKDFLTKAWQKNIFPVGPTGLMNLLLMSKYSIDGYERDKNQVVIIEEVVKLLNSIFTVFEYTKKTSRSLTAFNANFNKIVTCMNSSVFRSVDRIRSLGLKHNKSLNDIDKIPVIMAYQFNDSEDIKSSSI